MSTTLFACALLFGLQLFGKPKWCHYRREWLVQILTNQMHWRVWLIQILTNQMHRLWRHYHNESFAVTTSSLLTVVRLIGCIGNLIYESSIDVSDGSSVGVLRTVGRWLQQQMLRTTTTSGGDDRRHWWLWEVKKWQRRLQINNNDCCSIASVDDSSSKWASSSKCMSVWAWVDERRNSRRSIVDMKKALDDDDDRANEWTARRWVINCIGRLADVASVGWSICCLYIARLLFFLSSKSIVWSNYVRPLVCTLRLIIARSFK